MPDKMVDLLITFLRQNEGILSKRVLGKEFAQLTGKEAQAIESKYREVFLND